MSDGAIVVATRLRPKTVWRDGVGRDGQGQSEGGAVSLLGVCPVDGAIAKLILN